MLSSFINTAIAPYVFPDTVQARLQVRLEKNVSGRSIAKQKINFYLAPFFRLNIGPFQTPVGVRSLGLQSMLVRFNPARLNSFCNIAGTTEPIVSSVLEVSLEMFSRIQVCPTRTELTRIRAGYFDMSEIHLAADFRFPSRLDLDAFIRNFRCHWNWRFNRNKNDHYETSIYINQRHWTLLAYYKSEEIEARHSNWPLWTRERMRNCLRLEIRIKRRELRTLGKRLHNQISGFPLLDLSTGYDWDTPNILSIVFDFYVRRITPIHRRSKPNSDGTVPLYSFLAKYAACPTRRRSPLESRGSLA
jgi:hypothetical protein